MLQRTTLDTAERKGLKLVYLATYNGEGRFEPHTIGEKSDDGLTYSLTDENGCVVRYYWSKEVHYEARIGD